MKQVIEGLVYDTSKAKKLHEYQYCNRRDFNFLFEELYKTKNERYFIAGEGGANTIYREKVDNNSWTGSSSITPLATAEVINWLERHNGTEIAITEFKDELEDA